MIIIKKGSLAEQMIIQPSLKQAILKELHRDHTARNYAHHFSLSYYCDYSKLFRFYPQEML